MNDAVIFDLDGTLIDSRQDLAMAANAAIRAVGLPARDDATLIGFVGGGAKKLIERAVGAEHLDLAPAALEAFYAYYGTHLVDTTRAYSGIPELLAAHPGPLAVLTNKRGSMAREICVRLGIASRLAITWGADDTPAHKPDPRGCRALCAALGVKPERAVLVGDSRIDADTARAGGLRFIGVTWGFGTRAELVAAGATQLVDDAAALRRALLE